MKLSNKFSPLLEAFSEADPERKQLILEALENVFEQLPPSAIEAGHREKLLAVLMSGGSHE